MALLTLQNIFQKRSLQWNALIWLYKKTTKNFMSYKFYLIIHLYQSGLFKTFLSNKKTIAYILEICVITLKKKMKCVIDTFHSPKWIFLSYISFTGAIIVTQNRLIIKAGKFKGETLEGTIFYSAVTMIVSCYEVVYFVHCRKSRPNTVNNNKKKTQFVRGFKTILIKWNSFDIKWSPSLTFAQMFHKYFGRYIHFWFVKITDLF